MRRFIGLLLIFALWSCTDSNEYISIIQINDVYEIDALSGGEVGGLSRVATIIKQEKQRNPNTIVVLAGDFLSPSLLGTLTHQGKKIAGAQMIDLLNRIEVDLVVLGNHEFDLKQQELQERIDESQFDWLATNVYENQGLLRKKPFEKLGVPLPKTKIFSFDNDYKLAFIGATIDVNDEDYVVYTDFIKEAKESYERVSERSDMVLGLTHLTLDQDKEFSRELPQIPLIMGGHEHYNMDVSIGRSRITKADANAKSLYIHRLDVETLSITSELVQLDKSVKKDKVIQKRVNDWIAIQNAQLEKVISDPEDEIFYAESPLFGTEQAIRSSQTNLGTLICLSIMSEYEDEVEAAFVNSGSIRIDDDLSGEITGVDIFRILPYGGSLVKIKITGDLLVRTLNFTSKKTGSGAYLQYEGLSQNLESKRWYIGDTPIDRKKQYWIATSKFMLSGYDVPFFTIANKSIIEVVEPDKGDDAMDIRKVVISFLDDLDED